jgi:hypothetical protein
LVEPPSPIAKAMVGALRKEPAPPSLLTSPLSLPFSTLLGSAEPPAQPSSGSLARLIWPGPPMRAAPLYVPPKPVAPETKRRVFFSFQFDGEICEPTLFATLGRSITQTARPTAAFSTAASGRGAQARVARGDQKPNSRWRSLHIRGLRAGWFDDLGSLGPL